MPIGELHTQGHNMRQTNKATPPTMESIAETRRIYSVVFEQKETPPPQSVLITSGSKGEGKTTLACNLAVLAARDQGKKVLIIDYNWFAPAVHTQFMIPERSHTASHNEPENALDLVTQVPGIHGLSVLTAADFSSATRQSTNSLETEISAFMTEAPKIYEQIFIDASSVYPTNRNMNDPMLLAKATDGVILIALTNVTPKSKTKRACYALQSNGAQVLGVVANEWRNPLVQ